jgi:hypothetical protein
MKIYHHGEIVGNMPKLENCAKLHDEGTGRQGHYSEQGNRTVYEFTHKNGAISEIVSGSGYWPSKTGSGYDWGNDTVARPSEKCQCAGCRTNREILADFSRELLERDYEND